MVAFENNSGKDQERIIGKSSGWKSINAIAKICGLNQRSFVLIIGLISEPTAMEPIQLIEGRMP
ncbi:MAG: hypothetical protein KAI06_07425 [Anaerolineales bacterium]|nr:hypothetical protein [Anaerolineales bacterium]